MPRILQITDSHLTGRPPATPPRDFGDAVNLLCGRTTSDAAVAVCAAAEQHGPFDAILHTGDITDDSSVEGYQAALELLTDFGAPVLATPGNHDDPDLLTTVFGDRASATASHLDLGEWRLILISSLHPGHHSGTFSNETLAELADLLSSHGGPLLIGTHHPPLTTCAHADCINQRSAEFLALIDHHPNVRAVIAGHLHLADEVTRRGVQHMISPSTALQLAHIHPLEDNNSRGSQGGARILDLQADGLLTTELVWA